MLARRITGLTLLLLVLTTVLSMLAATPAQAIGVGCGKGCQDRVPSSETR